MSQDEWDILSDVQYLNDAIHHHEHSASQKYVGTAPETSIPTIPTHLHARSVVQSPLTSPRICAINEDSNKDAMVSTGTCNVSNVSDVAHEQTRQADHAQPEEEEEEEDESNGHRMKQPRHTNVCRNVSVPHRAKVLPISALVCDDALAIAADAYHEQCNDLGIDESDDNDTSASLSWLQRRIPCCFA